MESPYEYESGLGALNAIMELQEPVEGAHLRLSGNDLNCRYRHLGAALRTNPSHSLATLRRQFAQSTGGLFGNQLGHKGSVIQDFYVRIVAETRAFLGQSTGNLRRSLERLSMRSSQT